MTDPDTIRANIEATRLKTADDVDALAEKVSPHSIADRQKEKVKDRVRSVRESVMGAAHSASDTVGSATDALPDPKAGVAVAKGHPIAVGLVAFGVGWLVSSLLPTTSAERSTASTVKEKAAPLVDAAKDAAKDTAEQLKEPAKDAAENLKSTVTDAAGTVQEEGRSAASDVKGAATDAKDDVAGAARNG